MELSQGGFSVGELVTIKVQKKWIHGIIMNIRAPLGFRMYDVIELDTGRSHSVTRLNIEKVEVLSDFLAEEISEDGLGLGEKLTDEPKQEAKTHSRFEKLDSAEVDKLQMFAKSDKTHANTRWGNKIFRGKCFSSCDQIAEFATLHHRSPPFCSYTLPPYSHSAIQRAECLPLCTTDHLHSVAVVCNLPLIVCSKSRMSMSVSQNQGSS